jgi:DNA polymerase
MMEEATHDRANLGLGEQVSAAFDWWREAGVDCDFVDAPANWLASDQTARGDTPHQHAPIEESASPRAGGDLRQSETYREAARGPRPRGDAGAATIPPLDLSAMPPSLDAFVQWWLAEPTLDAARTSGRVPPRGPVKAELMVLVAHPEREDETRLLSGPQGRLLDGMLAAMGLAPEEAYVASVLPRHTPHADWASIASAGFGQITAQHIEIGAPRRLIAFGGNILPLLGHYPANNPGDLPNFNHDRASVPILKARELGVLLERPRWKAGFWHDWLSWVG